MLTPAQLERRTRGIGASEVSAIVDCNPYQTPTDVWLRKRRGPNLELPPVVVEGESTTNGGEFLHLTPMLVGSILEDGLASLYQHALRPARMVKCGTMIHPDYDYELATPDRAVYEATLDRGLEIKLVGRYVAFRWRNDTIPDYVVVQCTWGMWVTGLRRWDVCALIDGSRGFVGRLHYDHELALALHEAVTEFWEERILGNTPPPATGNELMSRLAALHSDPTEEVVDVSEDPHEFYARARALSRAKQALEEAKAAHSVATASLCEMVGEHKGVRVGKDKFLWYRNRGNVAYEALAKEAYGGIIPEETLEKHRGKPFRVPKLYLQEK